MRMNSVYLINHIKNYGYSIVTELIQRCKFDLVKEFVNNGVKLKESFTDKGYADQGDSHFYC